MWTSDEDFLIGVVDDPKDYERFINSGKAI